MGRVSTWGLVLVAGLAAGPAALPTAASAQSIGGRYQVQGKNPNGSGYAGQAEIIVTTENTCRIVWNTGGQISRGICCATTMRFPPPISSATGSAL
jgi:hypothetical protein